VKRIGHLYPSGGLWDGELHVMAPPDVHVLTTRMPFRATGLTDNQALMADLEHHSRLLADARPDLVAVNCTAATLLAGPRSVNARVYAATGIPSTTTIEAVVAALAAAGTRRIALLTPYPHEVVEAERQFLRGVGVEVVIGGGPACATPYEQGCLDPTIWLTLLDELDLSRVDGILLSCAGLQVSGVLGALEAASRRPVIASNAALVWHCLRLLRVGKRPTGHGSLLAGEHDEGAPPLPDPLTGFAVGDLQ
jgi:maleate isomerase